MNANIDSTTTEPSPFRGRRWAPRHGFAGACLAWNSENPSSEPEDRTVLCRSRFWTCVGVVWLAWLMGTLTVVSAEDARRDRTVTAVEKVLPAVVNIGTLTRERADPYELMLREFFGYGRRAPNTLYSSGSGVVIDEDGWVLTNFHVVRNADEVRVTLADQPDPVPAEVMAVSEANDLALLRLPATPGRKYPSVDFAPDDDLMLGETVVALGNPYGLGGSVSRGILSSKTRRAERDGESMEPADWLQTDAAINPGNSGGPLINLKGELIGLNVAILARAQGIGFAIPVKRIHTALAAMVSPEAMKGLWFGARLTGSRAPLSIAEIQPGSPADASGLKVGDEVVSVNGEPARTLLQVYRGLSEGPRDARLMVRRSGRSREIRVTLVAESTVFTADYFRRRLGLEFQPVPDDFQRQLRLDLSSGLWITAVEGGSPAERSGMQRGQILLSLDGQSCSDLIQLGRYLQRRKEGDTVEARVLSGRRRGMLWQLNESRIPLALR